MYTEDEITTDLATVKPLSKVEGWSEFYHSTKHIEPQTYLFDANRFCHKVYAQLDAFKSRHRYVIWLDADCVVRKRFGPTLIKKLLDGHMCAYLGRQGCYTETGFIAFDTHHPDFPEFEKRYREIYDKKYLFLADYWIDCIAFDVAIQGLSANNMTPEAVGMVDVFSKSTIGEFIAHHKGQGHSKYRGANGEQI